MARSPVPPEDRAHGKMLGRLIAETRSARQQSAPQLAAQSKVSIDAVRSIECGRVPLPSFLTVARLAAALGLSLDDLNSRAGGPASEESRR
ncbi:putative Xre family DNA binding protein [Gordonia polyisoprenivorans NBRC 16320 = JCM 10675]|uniref:Helix-turn-helix transcriptional regulator n=2 Tax=Gordonia polyisoprenivorans TaxID=84595 RepID=A0A846WKR3_9ACTN|nr:helix-turn-helix transcriptional regulator [Gordonia polyisoprenivorans]GAB25116.1 putative Xre family DNA binding protein [Gordonia polyisoprenivorans NBRC 16320 = JCM 10675]